MQQVLSVMAVKFLSDYVVDSQVIYGTNGIMPVLGLWALSFGLMYSRWELVC